MVEPLDLSILLDSPPQGSPPEVIAGIALQCDPLGLSHTGDLLQDPLTRKERGDLRWYLEEYWKWPYLEFAERGKQVEALLHAVGKRLYQAVLGGREAQALLHSWQGQSGVQRQINIVSALPHVLSLPWELLHDEHGFLALHPGHPTSIVRRLPLREQRPPSAPLEPPLRILLVTARPEGAGFVDPRSISRTLQEELQAQIDTGAIDLEFLRPPTLAALRDRLRDEAHPIHVLHFDGHGVFDEEEFGQGVLLFETEAGLPSPVKASDLAKVLRDRGIWLAVLTACQSAKSSSDDALNSVAAQLIQGGMDAVVAMGESFLVASATRYAEALYHALASGASMQLAQERARQTLHDDPRRHLHRRHRDEEGLPVEVYDWWIPHFFQRHSLNQQPTMRSRGTDPVSQRPSTPRFNEAMPAEPRYGFSGRTRELQQIERALLRRKLVAIHGFGGAGKTTLAREAADWLTWTNMFDCACFVSFEHGGDTALLLSVLGNFLGVYDGSYDPGDREAALARLEPVLKSRRVLVVIDNVEGIVADGEAPKAEEARAQLWDLLLQLSVLGAGILLTSRSPLTEVGVLAQGKRVAHLALRGLHPEDAHVLATRLLNDLGIDQERAPYAELPTNCATRLLKS